MTHFSRIGLRRRLVALAAAYGLALQALLSAFPVAAPALDPIICAAGAASHDGGTAPPAPHGPDCTVCPLACGAAALPPPLAARIAVTFGTAATIRARPTERPPMLIVTRAGLARAPPL
jgi:hypothetical protein